MTDFRYALQHPGPGLDRIQQRPEQILPLAFTLGNVSRVRLCKLTENNLEMTKMAKCDAVL